jgi:hypothetical protein
MAEIIQKNFCELKAGDKILIEVTVDSSVLPHAGIGHYVKVSTGHGARDVFVAEDMYHGCINPPRTIVPGMKFLYNYRKLEVAQIYHITDAGRAYSFDIDNPSMNFSNLVKDLATDPNIEWVE